MKQTHVNMFLVGAAGLLTMCESVCAEQWLFRSGGTGTTDAPYIVTDVNDLQAMSYDLSASYALGYDIEASDTRNWNGGMGFQPVGTSSAPFTGTFDGDGYVVTGLYINRPSANSVGLFGYIGDTATIDSVGLLNHHVIARGSVGALVGSNRGTIRNSYANGTVNGVLDVGGLVGYNGNTITHCVLFHSK